MKYFLRTLLERLSRRRILKRKICVKDKSVSIYVSPDSQLKYLKFGRNVFDYDLIRIAETFLTPSSNVWDIGANIGIFTFAAATIANQGTILAVEGDIWLAQLLRKTTKIQGNTSFDIRILPAAVSSQNGIATFMIAQRGRASNALEVAGGSSQMGGVREKQFVPTLTLDTLLSFFPLPDFVKIDIEGAEWMAIQGAKKIIQEVRPVIYMEISSKYAEKIYNVFKTEDYTAYDGESGSAIKTCANNTFFIPNENREAQQLLRLL